MRKLFAIIFLFLSISYSCKKDTNETIPNVYVNFSIQPDNTTNLALNTIGGWEYVTGGYSGILIYRQSSQTFLAYDRACPYDYASGCRVTVESSFIVAKDTSCCKSQFLISIDGSPVSGSKASVSLKQYRTTYDGVNLLVSN